MKKIIISIFCIAFIVSGCKKDVTTIIEGAIVHSGTKAPLDSVKIHVLAGTLQSDGWFSSNNSSSKNQDFITYSDANGKFKFQITAPEDAGIYLELEKANYYWQTSGGNRFEPYEIGKSYTHEYFEMKYPVDFYVVLQSKSSTNVNDLIYYSSFNVGNKFYDFYTFNGIGPFERQDFVGANGNTYKKYYVKTIQNGITKEWLDSVYVPSVKSFTDTIYY